MAFISTFFLPPLNLATPGSLSMAVPSARATAASAATLPRARAVLPDRNGLGAERNAVQSGLVAVLTGDRNRASQALGLESSHNA